MKSAIIFVITLILITGCSVATPDNSVIQTAIANTQAAQPTSTESPTPESTATFVPSPTYTPGPTDTPEPTSTTTPTSSPTPDLRIIEQESKNFLCEKEDLPEESRYFIPNSGWISPHLNKEIISSWGEKAGREYLEETKRIEGWWVYFYRGSETIRAPEEIFCNVIRYETVEGARISILDYNILDRRLGLTGWSRIDKELEIGDLSYPYLWKEMQPNGKNKVRYRLEIAYRNYVIVISGYGWEQEVPYDLIENVASNILDKLDSAPLADPQE